MIRLIISNVMIFGLVSCSLNSESHEGNSRSKNQSKVDEKTSEVILGQTVKRSESWYVSGRDIYYGDKKVLLKGLNWFGFDTEKLGLHGLWSGRSIEDFLQQIKGLGFNALRIPLSPQALDASRPGSDGYGSPVAQLEDLMKQSSALNIHLLFDFHNCHYSLGHLQASPDAASGPGEACEGYGTKGWLSDLRKLSEMVKAYKNVVGIDLFNEPYGMSWQDWKKAVDLGAKAVLEVNPNILIFVEGVAGSPEEAGGYAPFWGGNLVDALKNPVDVPKSRLVFAPHAYGPSVFSKHDYFHTPSFPSNMPAIWNTHFGYLSDSYPIAIGEFGGKYTKFENDKDRLWQDAFVAYLVSKDMPHFFYWSLNPNSGDTGGILEDDWKTVDQKKVQLLKPLLEMGTIQ